MTVQIRSTEQGRLPWELFAPLSTLSQPGLSRGLRRACDYLTGRATAFVPGTRIVLFNEKSIAWPSSDHDSRTAARADLVE